MKNEPVWLCFNLSITQTMFQKMKKSDRPIKTKTSFCCQKNLCFLMGSSDITEICSKCSTTDSTDNRFRNHKKNFLLAPTIIWGISKQNIVQSGTLSL